MNLSSIGSPALSASMFRTVGGRVVNRTGTTLAVGEIVAIDLIASGSQQTETAAGQGVAGITGLSELSAMFQNVITPTLPTENTSKIYGVVTDLLDGAGADNTDVDIAIQGVVECLVNSDVDPGEALMIDTPANKQLVTHVPGADVARVGVALETVTGAATAANALCIFNGLAGIDGTTA